MARWAPHPFSLRQLQYALAVAELRSFRGAAEACHVAQPSLSAQIAQLEESLGVRLFERSAKGVLVTEAGAQILERARRVVVDADDLVEAAERGRDPFSGTLRLGVIPTVAPYLLPNVAPKLRARFPKLRPVWVEEKTRVLLARVEAGELDGAILALEPELSALEHETIGRDPFLIAAPPGHPLGKSKGPASPGDLEGHQVLLLEDGHCFRDQALEVCSRAGADEAGVRATSLSTLAQMVAGGGGVTLLPAIAVAAENRAGGLSVRPFGKRGPSRTLVLAWRKSSPLGEVLRAVGQAIRAEFDALLARAGSAASARA